MENIDEALSLLVIGMITVLIILVMVVFIGNLVIRLTNRFIPVKTQLEEPATPGHKIQPKKLATLVAAVDIVTNGKGKIERIDKK
jgi:oxaloacetate decarboxylase gamma subunit